MDQITILRQGEASSAPKDARNLADETWEWSKESLGEGVGRGGLRGGSGERWDSRRFLYLFGPDCRVRQHQLLWNFFVCA
jgi:hypothetical protein